MQVPSLDLKSQYNTIKQEIDSSLSSVINSHHFVLGPVVEKLEAELAGYLGVRYAITVASGSDAILISLMALGIGGGNKVITTPFTFFATAGSIARLGARPIFVDIDPETYNISPSAIKESIAGADSDGIKAIIPVHLYGQSADMSEIMAISKEFNIPVIEDAAQSLGSEYTFNGKDYKTGTIGLIGCYSFYPTKNLGGWGDGGLITTNDESIARMIKCLRIHGAENKYYHKYIGLNSRLDAIQSAVLRVKLKHLDTWNQERFRHAKVYDQLLKDCNLLSHLTLPLRKPNRNHIYHQYTLYVHSNKNPETRDKLKEFLKQNQIDTEIYYPLPLHLQECFQYLGYKKRDLPNAEQSSISVLSLPICPELTYEKQRYVVEKIKQFFMST
ncbi:MAG: DegT/DnrJ/EryC1/StrS family aminotransferase [Planctomycetota bacterium]|nr:DegT/DnrJ/EryC1/StrS family aminotransferase [Planctomycetota bacterium]MDI6786746.1 DegT/DnrJ/EryC1/StrS family aminotransferase [Planctomycetota bacterium]